MEPIYIAWPFPGVYELYTNWDAAKQHVEFVATLQFRERRLEWMGDTLFTVDAQEK